MIDLLMRRREMVEVDTIPYDAEIEYLEATGTQYIDTLLAYNGAWNVKAAVQNTDVRSSARDRRYFGGVQSFQKNGICFTENSFVYMKNLTVCNTYNKSGVTYLSFIGGVLSVTGSVSVSKTIETNMSTAPVSITLFCEHRPNNSLLSFLTGRIYYFSLGTNEDANNILDMIPVRKNGIGYMYDKISGQLFANAGTGNFNFGNDKN